MREKKGRMGESKRDWQKNYKKTKQIYNDNKRGDPKEKMVPYGYWFFIKNKNKTERKK